MKVIAWNICGLGNDNSRNSLKNLCRHQNPNWVGLFEPKILSSTLSPHFLSARGLHFFAENARPPLCPNI